MNLHLCQYHNASNSTRETRCCFVSVGSRPWSPSEAFSPNPSSQDTNQPDCLWNNPSCGSLNVRGTHAAIQLSATGPGAGGLTPTVHPTHNSRSSPPFTLQPPVSGLDCAELSKPLVSCSLKHGPETTHLPSPSVATKRAAQSIWWVPWARKGTPPRTRPWPQLS